MALEMRRARGMNRRCPRSERGAVQVEFALASIIILSTMFLLWEAAMLMYTYNVMADAAKEGVRYAIVHGSSNSSSSQASVTDVTNVVTDYAKMSFHDISDSSKFNVNVTYTPNNNPSSTVRVTVSYAYQPYVNFGWTFPTISAASQGVIVF
jgi:Flp pilus assembly protein TadG